MSAIGPNFLMTHLHPSLSCLLFIVVALASSPVWSADSVSPSWPPLLKGQATTVAVDAQGNRYVIGSLSLGAGTIIDTDPRSGAVDEVTTIGGDDLLVTRIDADGTYAWSQIIGGNSVEYAGGVAVINGRVFVAGWTYSSNLGIGGPGVSPPMGHYDAFVVSLDALTGEAIATFGSGGVQRIGGSGFDSATAVVATTTAVYVAGLASGTDVGIGGPGTISTIGGTTNAMVVALNPLTGAPLTSFSGDGVQLVGDNYWTEGRALALQGGVLYLGGIFGGSSVGIGTTGTLATTGGYDAFVAALNATTGAAVTTFSGDGLQRVGGTAAENLYALAVDATTVYLTGDFAGLNLGINGTGTVGTAGAVDVFVAALNRSNGNGKAGFGNGGVQVIGGSHWDYARSMQVSGGVLYLAGEFWSNNLGIGGTGTVASLGQDDGLLLALSTTTGLGQAGFGSGGIIRFGGVNSDKATGLAMSAAAMSLVGQSWSVPATMGLPGQGGWATSFSWNSVLLTLTPASGAQVQDLRFAEIAARPTSSPPFTLDITPAATGNPVTVTSSYPGIATVSGTTVTIVGPGTVTLTATQAAGGGFPAVSVARTLTVVPDSTQNAWPPILRAGGVATAVDASGNRYVVGSFSGSYDFDPRSGEIDLITTRAIDTYLTRINSDGTYGWTTVIGGSLNDTPIGVVVAGNTVFVCGEFAGNDLGIDGAGTLASLGSNDLFVAAIDLTTGTAVTSFNGGVQRIGGDSTEYARAIVVSGSMVYVAGESWSPNIGIGALGTQGTLNATLDAFVAALSTTTGAAVTAFSTDGIQIIGGTGDDRVAALGISGSSLVAVGEFGSSNLGIGGTGALAATGWDAYVAELSLTTGAAVTAFSTDGLTRLDSSNFVTPRDVAVANGNLYVTGQFSGPLAIDGSGGTISPIGNYDVFVAAINATTGMAATFGTFGIQRIGGYGTDTARAVVADGTTVHVLLDGNSNNVGIGGVGPTVSRFSTDLFLAALDSTTGAARSAFGTSGVLYVSGSISEIGRDLVLLGSDVLMLATTDSTSLTLGSGPTAWTTTSGWSTLMLTLAGSTGLQPQTLALAAIPTKGINDPPFTVQVTPDPSGNPVTITCDTPSVATVSGTTVTLTGTFGNARIYATQAAGGGKSAVTVSRPLVVQGDGSVASWPPNLRGPITAVAEDSAGNRYVAGTFSGGMDFDPRVGSIQVRGATGLQDVFVTRINADGSYAWTQVIGGSSWDYAHALVVGNGVVYVGGEFSGNDFGIGAAGTFASVAEGTDGYIAALDATTGAAKIAFGTGGLQRVGGNQIDSVRGLALSGALYFTGYFASTNLGIGTIGSTMPLGSADAMVGAISPVTGAAVTAFAGTGVQHIGVTGYAQGYALRVANDRVLAVGKFGGADLGVGALGSAAAVAQEDGFVVALDATSGAAVTGFSTDGIQTFGGHYDDSATSLAIHDGTIYVAGIFNSIDLGIGGPGTLATTGINNDVVVVALAENDGSPRSGFATGGAQRLGGSLHDAGYGIVANADGVYIAGSFQGIDFGIGGRGTFAAVRDMDAFVARLDLNTGLGVNSFSSDALERIGGSSTDRALALMLGRDGRVVVAGEMMSSDGGIGDAAPGGWGGGSWRGFVLSLDPLSGLRPQQITMAPLRAIALGSAPFTPAVTADPLSGNPVTLTSDRPSVALVAGSTVAPVHAGTATIIAHQAAGNGFSAASVGRVLPVVADDWTTTWPPVAFGTVRAVTCDEAGNRYIAGDFSNHRDFDPRRGSVDPQATYGYTDVFVTRFNADGSYAWTQVIVGTAEELAKAIAATGHEIIVTGTFRSANLGIDGLGTMASMGGTDVFVAKLAAATGEPVTTFGTNGLQRIGSQGNDNVSDLVLFDVKIYLTGTYLSATGDTVLAIGTPGAPLVGGPEVGAFVAALTGDGAPLPGFSGDGIQVITAGTSITQGRALAYTNIGLVVGGSFNGNNLGIGGPGSLAAASSSFDGFLAALDPSSGGAVTTFGSAGLQKITGAVDEEVWDIASNGNDLYTIGTFSSADLGIGAVGSQSSIAGPDVFVAALTLSTGTANTAFSGDGLVMIASSSTDNGRRIAVLGNDVIAIGDFTGSNLGIGGYGALKSSGYNSVFIARLSRTNGSAVTTYSGDGLERIGGTGNDMTADALGRSSTGDLIVAANIESSDAGYGAPGPWDGDFSRNGLVLTIPLNGVFPVGIDVLDTTVVVDGNPHHAPIALLPNGLRVSVTYNGSGTAPSAIGTYAVQATITQSGYSGAASGTLIIAKAKLFVTADDKERRRGAADPPFTASYSGFVGGDTASLITTSPVFATTATSASPTGSHPITPSGTIAPGYLVVHVPGTLSIFDFGVVNVTLRGTVAGGTAPTVQVDSTAATQVGPAWEATGAVSNDTNRVFEVDASNSSGGTDHETITIEAVDLPLGGG